MWAKIYFVTKDREIIEPTIKLLATPNSRAPAGQKRWYLARGCAVIAALLDPQAVILGGGLIENNPLLFSVLVEELPKHVRPKNRQLRVMSWELGYYGGVQVAAALAFESKSGEEQAKPPPIAGYNQGISIIDEAFLFSLIRGKR